ncbi:putative thiamine transport system permease protein [Roseivivax marinus]|nr:putative thiamine transport system permease protein [Roseivivax marinus]
MTAARLPAGLRALPPLTMVAMLGPVAAGLAGTLLPAAGFYPAAGLTTLGLGPLQSLLDWPGLAAAVRLSLTTGFLATFAALAITALFLAGWSGTRAFLALERVLSPLLSVPHAAAAFGLAFLVAPSGWLARLLSPWLTGWERPPDIAVTQDHWGLAMAAGLTVKEMPFLLLMALAALGQSDATRRMRVAAALGYGRVAGWLLAVFPSIYAQIRLPVYVVLAYSMSVVDVALILGPTTPPTLSVQIVRWMGDPDLAMRLTASAGAVLQLVLVGAALLVWRAGEGAVAFLGRRWIGSGLRAGRADAAARPVALGAAAIAAGSVLLGLLTLGIWSVAGFWGFPDPLPGGLDLRSWMRFATGGGATVATTALIAAIATGLSLIFVIGCLEAEHRRGKALSQKGLWLIYLPLLVPQVAFLPGLQTLLLSVGLKSGLGPVILAHVVFVLPYLFLSLGDPWRAWDPRYATTAAALGARPAGVLWRVRLPMLLRPILTAAAVAMAVSVGQYLPTLIVGGGRVDTLTTEAVALASGGDRRAIGVYGLAQTAAVMVPFGVALIVPALVFRNRRALRG